MTGLFGWKLGVGPVAISAHFFLETLAYFVGFALYRRERRAGDVVSLSERSSVIVAAVLGAAAGSKLLAIVGNLGELGRMPLIEAYEASGKTIVGALLGGTLAVEWIKKRLGIVRRTGDLFAIPLTVGIAIGRIGCFLAGLEDRTYGVATSLPWGIDFGDGIRRHPTQLYEVAFLMLLAGGLLRMKRAAHREGDLYRAFLLVYMAWRFTVDFLKPDPAILGLSAIQWAAAAALVWYAPDALARIGAKPRAEAHG